MDRMSMIIHKKRMVFTSAEDVFTNSEKMNGLVAKVNKFINEQVLPQILIRGTIQIDLKHIPNLIEIERDMNGHTESNR